MSNLYLITTGILRKYIYNANLTVTPHLTLKMTAAEAVETSVTTINSLSQDFTNLDDQPSQTLTDTPGFKPFTLMYIYIYMAWRSV